MEHREGLGPLRCLFPEQEPEIQRRLHDFPDARAAYVEVQRRAADLPPSDPPAPGAAFRGPGPFHPFDIDLLGRGIRTCADGSVCLADGIDPYAPDRKRALDPQRIVPWTPSDEDYLSREAVIRIGEAVQIIERGAPPEFAPQRLGLLRALVKDDDKLRPLFRNEGHPCVPPSKPLEDLARFSKDLARRSGHQEREAISWTLSTLAEVVRSRNEADQTEERIRTLWGSMHERALRRRKERAKHDGQGTESHDLDRRYQVFDDIPVPSELSPFRTEEGHIPGSFALRELLSETLRGGQAGSERAPYAEARQYLFWHLEGELEMPRSQTTRAAVEILKTYCGFTVSFEALRRWRNDHPR